MRMQNNSANGVYVGVEMCVVALCFSILAHSSNISSRNHSQKKRLKIEPIERSRKIVIVIKYTKCAVSGGGSIGWLVRCLPDMIGRV